MEPFDTHPARPSTLRSRADEFMRLAEQAVDLEAVTSSEFRPATASWEGIAAPELRAVGNVVWQRAADVAESLAWTVAPLRYWADRVETFNNEAKRLRDRYEAVPAEVDAEFQARYGDTPYELQHEIDDMRTAEIHQRRRDLERQWHELYDREIYQGARDTAAMLRDGPTWQHQALARRIGLFPAAGLFTFFAAQWEAATAVEEVMHLAERIVNATERPDLEAAERLAYLLDRFATDEAFAYNLLTALGPEGLVTLYGSVALMQRAGTRDEVDMHLADLQAAIQVGLATALAVATRRRGTGGGHMYAPYTPGENELPLTWIHELMTAGRQQFDLAVPMHGGLGNTTASLSPYGYQLIGVMLSASKVPFDTDVLVLLGKDLLDFERTVGWSKYGGGNVPIWYDVWIASNSPGQTPIRLNWTDGVDGDANAGYDPVQGLMRALTSDVEATRRLFHQESWHETETIGQEVRRYTRLPIVDYLLTQRLWVVDVTGQYYDDTGPTMYPPELFADRSWHNPGHALLGRVLEGATVIGNVNDVDYRAVGIFEAVVRGLNANQPGGNSDLIPAALRGTVARMIEDYIYDVNNAMGDYEMFEARGAELKSDDLRRILTDIARDEEAAETVRIAQHAYTYSSFVYFLSGAADPQSSLESRLLDAEQVAIANGRVLAALDMGIAENTILSEEERLRELLETRQKDRAWFDYVADGIDLALNIGLAADQRTPPVADEVIKTLVRAAFSLVRGEPLGLTDEERGSVDRLRLEVEHMLDQNAELIAKQFEYAAYDSGALTELPPELVTNGQPLPRTTWAGDAVDEIWKKYLRDTPEGRLVRESASSVIDEYRDALAYYKTVTEF